MLGKQILHYRIEEQLGQGAMGSVYRARDLRLDTVRALKFIRPDLVGDQEARESLHGEARSQARLLHPHVATLFALESSPEGDFLVQEYVDGPDLASWLEDTSPPLEERLRILLEVTAALDAAHRNGIIHRDIKPGNVLVDPEGHAKVTDFGLARALEQHSMSATVGVKGTAPYIPPEAFRGERITRASDVWSLGILAQEMLQGTRPFTAETIEALAVRIMSEPHPPLPPEVVDRVPGLGAWLDDCLQKDPAERVPDGSTAYVRLADLLHAAGLSVPVSPTGVRYAGRARKGLSPVVLAVGLVLLITAVGFLRPWRWLSGGTPRWDWAGWPASGAERSPSWDPQGNRLAFLVDGSGTPLQIVDTTLEEPIPVPEPIAMDGTADYVSWSPTGTVLALSGPAGLYIHDLLDHHTTPVVPRAVESPSWSQDGTRIVYRDPPTATGPAIRTVGPIGGMLTAPASVRISGIPPPLEGIQFYNPVFILQDRFLAFVVSRYGDNLGVYQVPTDGGAAVRIVDPGLRPWGLEWDPSREELVFSRLHETDLLRLRIDEEGRPVGTPRSLDTGKQIWDFDLAGSSQRLALVTSQEVLQVWGSPLEGDRAMTPLIEQYENTYTPALSRDGEHLYISVSDPDQGQHILAYRFADGAIEPLHAENPRYANEWYPTPDPASGRYVVYLASTSQTAGLFYYDFQTQGIAELAMDPPGGRLGQPIWAPDGGAIYCVVSSTEKTEPARIVRLALDRDGAGLHLRGTETVLQGDGLKYPVVDRTDRYLAYARGSADTDSLFLLDRVTGSVRLLARGYFPAAGPTGDDLYFVRGTSIFRIQGWTRTPLTDPVPVADLPVGVTGLRIARSIAVGEDRLYAILPHRDPGSLLWSPIRP